MVRRGSISPEPNEYQISTNSQLQSHNQPTQPKFYNRRISRSAPMRGELHDKKYIFTTETPKTVRQHNPIETNNRNEHHTNISNRISPSPSPPPTAEQTTTTNLHEIPSKAKWSTRKKILVGISASLLLIALIVIPIVLGILLTRSSESTTTRTATTTVSPTIVSASWTFDNVTTEVYGVYNGQMINGATYSSNQVYVGYGRALSVVSASNQSFQVSTPFLDLSFTSFTIEAWIFISGSTAVDYGIFGQCQCSTCANQCLYFIVRATHLYIGFTFNDLTGTSALTASTWYHIAFVYNYQTQQQILYVNGVQDTIKSNAQPYQGKNGTIQIGSTQVYSTTNYFYGFIDNLNVVTRAKSTAEILNDASLMIYYSFDLPNVNYDHGPNGLNGTPVNTVIVTGRVNQAMRFSGSSSYFQAYGFYQVPCAVTPNKPFSISLWISPSSLTSSTLIQLSAYQTSSFSYCINLLSIISVGTGGQIAAQLSSSTVVYGPFLTLNTWTHISITYSGTTGSGYTLYVNGNLFASIGSYTFSTYGQLIWLYVGYAYSCSSFNLNAGYQGSIDEMYIYNRELTQTEVTALANP